MERYNEYKDSGVQWLGEIPSHWEVVRLKSVIKDSQSGVWGEDPKHDGSDTLCLRVADFNYNNGYLKEDNLTYRNYGKELSSNKQLQMRDLLLEKSGGGDLYPVGRVVRYNFNGIVATCSNFIQKLTPRDNVDSDFIYYLFRTMYYLKVNGLYYNQTTGIQNLKVKEYLSQTVFLPPLSEQQAIANYLDTATAKIDEAIAQQQKMIGLLNERKQIIINNAVTKGLNPDAPMKDSGVEWIGEIPEHWEVSRIKNVITLLTDYDANGSFSDIAKNCNINNGTPYAWMVRTTDLVNNRVGIVEGNNYCDKKTYDYLAKSSLESGDLLMTKRGNVGMVYVVPECSCPMTLAPNLYLLKTKASDINNRYLMHYLSSTKPKSQLAILNKSTTLGALYKDDVKSLQIVLPPIDEQLLLAQFIDKELDKVDSVISNCNRQISLLQERKQIIINDVVTGKVKVS